MTGWLSVELDRTRGLPICRGSITIVRVLSPDEVRAIVDPVERAAVANDLIWTNCDQRTSLRTVRNQALREAVDSGRSSLEIAERLHVTEKDVGWMTKDTAAAG